VFQHRDYVFTSKTQQIVKIPIIFYFSSVSHALTEYTYGQLHMYTQGRSAEIETPVHFNQSGIISPPCCLCYCL